MKTPRVLIVLVIAILCTLILAAPASAGVTLNKYEKQVVALVNKERVKRGLPKLRVNVRLVKAARYHSQDMGKRKYFAHNSPGPKPETWSARLIRYGYKRSGCSYWKAGENIYYGSGLYSSPAAVVKAWMKSSGHRKVILTKTFRDVGIGAVKTQSGYRGINGVVWFFTLDLGRRVAK